MRPALVTTSARASADEVGAERPGPERSTGRATGWRTALALLVLLAACRGLLVASLADVFRYGEELQKGAAGKALIDGLPLPWHTLPFHAYEGGGFVVSHLDALAFLVVGESVLALKLVAFGFDAAILLIGWSFARWAFGGRAAAVFGVLAVLAPASVQKQALLALGIHYQALPFALLILYLGARAAFDRDLRRRTLVPLGLAAGFGVYFSYQVVLPVGFVGLVLLFRERRALLGRPAIPGWIAVAVGALPLAWMALQSGSGVLDIHGTNLFEAAGRGSKLDRLGACLRSIYVGRELADLVPLVGRPLCVAAAFALAVTAAPGSRARRCALFLGAYLALFFVAYATSGFAIGRIRYHFLLHRLLPAWPLAALLVGAGVQQGLARRGALRVATAVGAAFLALAGLRDLWVAAAEGSPADWRENLPLVARTKGYTIGGYVSKVTRDLPTPEERFAVAEHFRDPDPAQLRRHTASVFLTDRQLTLRDVRRIIEGRDADDRSGYWLGLGVWLRSHRGGTVVSRVRAVEREPEAELLVEAIGRLGSEAPPTLYDVQADVDTGLEAGLPPAFFRGLGALLYELPWRYRSNRYWDPSGPPLAFAPRVCEAFLARQDPRVRKHLREGYRRAVAENTLW